MYYWTEYVHIAHSKDPTSELASQPAIAPNTEPTAAAALA